MDSATAKELHTTSQLSLPPTVPQPLSNGFLKARSEIITGHPLEKTEINYQSTQEALKMDILKDTYGIAMPIKLEMEKWIVTKSQRLPPLHNENLSLDVLLGRDHEIGFEDFLHPQEFFEEEVPCKIINQQLMKKSPFSC